MNDAKSELEHLELCQVCLQRIFESKRGEEVVTVHEGMDQRIDPGAEVSSAVAHAVVEKAAPNDADSCVVIDVEEGELFVLLAKDDEDGVEHVEELGEVVSEDPELDGGVELSVDVEKVGELKEEGKHSDHHQRRNDNLKEVVEEHRSLEDVTDFGAILHDDVSENINDDSVSNMTTNDELFANEEVQLRKEAKRRRWSVETSDGLFLSQGSRLQNVVEDKVVKERRHF
jgi:hypothetical protein